MCLSLVTDQLIQVSSGSQPALAPKDPLVRTIVVFQTAKKVMQRKTIRSLLSIPSKLGNSPG